MAEQEVFLDAITQIRSECTSRRLERLHEGGFAAYFAEAESQIVESLIPVVSEGEGMLIAQRFRDAAVDLTDFELTQPEGSTAERAFFRAVDANLRIYGDDVLVRVESLVEDRLVPLRRKKEDGDSGSSTVEEPRYEGVPKEESLSKATRGLMNSIWVVARMFQLSDEELSSLHTNKTPQQMRQSSLDSLRMLLVAQVLKGQAQANGFMARSMHEEQIWFLGGGVRGIPPGGAAVIGEFIDSLLASGQASAQASV